MSKIIGEMEAFKSYIRGCSAAIANKESNGAYDWRPPMNCSFTVDGVPCRVSIKVDDASEQGDFLFSLYMEIRPSAPINKDLVEGLFCRIAEEIEFHPNIRILRPSHWKNHNEHWSESTTCSGWNGCLMVSVKLSPDGNSFDLSEDPVNILRKAIKERDEEIARKVAEERAKSNALQKIGGKIESFLESIGDFVIPDRGPDGQRGQRMAYMWMRGEGSIVLLGGLGQEGHRDPVRLKLEDGYEANVKAIVEWAVRNGAREPELD